MKKKWKDFISKLNAPVLFLYRGEIEKKLGISDIELLVILTTRGTRFDVRLSSESLNEIKHLEDLIEQVEKNCKLRQLL